MATSLEGCEKDEPAMVSENVGRTSAEGGIKGVL